MDPHRSLSLPANSSPKLAWGSPAASTLRPMSTFPPNNMVRSPSGPPRTPRAMGMGGPTAPAMPWFSNVGDMGLNSSQFLRHAPPRMFRTPQPQPRTSSNNQTQRSPWSDNRGNQRKRFSMSPQSSPHSSPKPYHFGGHSGSPMTSPRSNLCGNSITLYYKPSMLEDPWKNMVPVPTNLQDKGFP